MLTLIKSVSFSKSGISCKEFSIPLSMTLIILWRKLIPLEITVFPLFFRSFIFQIKRFSFNEIYPYAFQGYFGILKSKYLCHKYSVILEEWKILQRVWYTFNNHIKYTLEEIDTFGNYSLFFFPFWKSFYHISIFNLGMTIRAEIRQIISASSKWKRHVFSRVSSNKPEMSFCEKYSKTKS